MSRHRGLSRHQHWTLLVCLGVVLLTQLSLAVRRVVNAAVDAGSPPLHLDVKTESHWYLLGHRFLPFEDKSDFQWFGFRDQLPATLLIAITHIVAVHVIDHVFHRARSVRAFLQATTGVAAVVYLHGQDSVIVLGCLLIFYAVSCLTKCRFTRWSVPWITWTLAITVLILTTVFTHHTSTLSRHIKHILNIHTEEHSSPHDDDKHRYPATRSINLLVLRLVSFNMDRYWRSKQLAMSGPPIASTSHHYRTQSGRPMAERTTDRQQLCIDQITMARSRPLADYNLLFLLAYAFFMPLYVAGPIIAFNSFCHSLSVHTIARRRWLLKACGRWLLTLFLTEIIFNRILLPSCLGIEEMNRHLWREFSVIEIISLSGSVLFYTWAKFVVLWSGFRIWSILSGFYCPANLSTFLYDYYSAQSFWKDWHRSFHLWMLRYMYIPLGGNRRKVRATCLIFLFAALWHRVNISYFAWAVITVFTILFELGFERHLGVSLVKKRLHTHKSYATLMAGCELIAALLIFANLVGFGPGWGGLVEFTRLCVTRPDQTLMAIIFFGFLGFIHVSYLVDRDLALNPCEETVNS